MNGTIWIIVPVYNVEKLLGKCVKSIQKQTYKNWKLVLVDDGSTDSSGKLCDEFASGDDRISVVHTENCGLPGARRNGLRQIPDSGYCCFCDSDDELPDNALQALYAKAEETKADLVSGCMVRVLKGLKLPYNAFGQIPEEKDVFDREEMLSSIYIGCFGMNIFLPNLWGKIYRIEKLKKVMLDGSRIPKYFAEDLDVILRLMPTLDKVAFVHETVYFYRTGGGTSKFMPSFLEDNLFMYNRKLEHMKHYTGELDAHRLLAIEMKNIAVTYFSMCHRFSKFPNGENLRQEIEYVCSLPELKDALPLIEGDTSGVAGAGDAMRSGNYDEVIRLICEQNKSAGLKGIVKNILARL